ncbi:unnamed protein product, partial [Adineta steineri]
LDLSMYLKNNQPKLIAGRTADGSITDYYNNETHLNNAIVRRAHHQTTYIIQLNAVSITGRNSHTHVYSTCYLYCTSFNTTGTKICINHWWSYNDK